MNTASGGLFRQWIWVYVYAFTVALMCLQAVVDLASFELRWAALFIALATLNGWHLRRAWVRATNQ